MKRVLLVADIGGTKSEFATFMAGDPTTPLFQKRFVNARYSSFDDVVRACMEALDTLPTTACFAVAGLVSGGRAQMTNLSWELVASQLQDRFGFREVLLINDLTALSNSLHLLDHNNPSDLLTLYDGDHPAAGVRAVLAPGTGLGEGFVVDVGGRRFVTGTEGGHTDFAPVDEEQLALLSWMRAMRSPVSYETLVAGPGLAYLYDFCKFYHGIRESADIARQMHGMVDRTPGIVAGAINDPPCPLCRKTVDLFLRILGSEAGNLALKTYARGGVYLGGGILPRIAHHVSFAGFIQRFLDKGAMQPLLKTIPVRLILSNRASLMGAAGFLLLRPQNSGVIE